MWTQLQLDDDLREALHIDDPDSSDDQGGGMSYWLARRLILTRVHEALGLDRAAHPITGGFYSSAAPLSTQVRFVVLLVDNISSVIVQGLNIMNEIVDIQIYEILWTLEIKICQDYHTHPCADIQLLHVT